MVRTAGTFPVVFVHHPYIVVVVHRHQHRRGGVVFAVVHAEERRPVRRYEERLYPTLRRREHRKIAADDCVPIAVFPRSHQLRVAQAIEALLVAWVRSEADLVIANAARDKHPDHPGCLVLERHHPVWVAVDAEIAFYLGVAAPARVAGSSHPLVLGRAA